MRLVPLAALGVPLGPRRDTIPERSEGHQSHRLPVVAIDLKILESQIAVDAMRIPIGRCPRPLGVLYAIGAPRSARVLLGPRRDTVPERSEGHQSHRVPRAVARGHRPIRNPDSVNSDLTFQDFK